MIRIRREDPVREDVLVLLRESDAHMGQLYPLESIHRLDVAVLRQPNVSFFVARAGDELLGCAALVQHDGDWSELKRMFVVPKARGRGIGRLLLEYVEKVAAEAGCRTLRLETGVLQPEALSLYVKGGFIITGPFGDYGPDPLSIFMEKKLGM
jgi:putative acetyltransferase